jgi:vitamin B12 transporter
MKKKFILLFSVLSIVSFGQQNIQGASTKGMGDTLLKPLDIILEKRMPSTELVNFSGNVTVLSQADIKKLPITTIQEALQYVAGVDVRSRNSVAQGDVSLWGSTFEQVLILIDGIPMRDPQTGHHQLNLPIDLGQVQSIQVIKGAAARMYGAGALAGAINIITKDPGTIRASVQSFWGTNMEKDTASGENYLANQQIVQIGFNKGNTGHSISFRRLHSNGYEYNTGVEQQGVFYRGKWNHQRSQWNWLGGYLNNKFGAKYFYAAPYDVNAIEQVQTAFGGVSGQLQTGKIQWTPRLYYRYNTDDYIFVAQQPEIYRNHHYSTSTGAEINGNFENQWGVLGFGMESRADFIRSNNLGKHERFLHSAYIEEQFQLTQKVQLTMGVNTQISPSYKTKVFPSVDLLYKKNHAQFFVHGGTGSRLPSYTDLYYQDSKNLGNPNLSTEYGWTAETGVRHFKGLQQFQLTYFYRRVSNQIDFTQGYVTGIDPNKWYPLNIGLSQFAGTEIQWSGRLAEQNILDNPIFCPTHWGIRSNFLTSTMSNENYTSKYVFNQLNQQHIAFIGFKSGPYVQHQLTYRAWQRSQQNTIQTLDWRSSFQLDQWSLFFDISNITNQHYSLSGNVFMPGRWYQMGVQFQLMNNAK